MAKRQKDRPVLELPAIEIPQGPGRRLYSFAVDGKAIPQFATISRVRRKAKQANTLLGYQRAEVISHIREIRNYLESPDPLLPNSIVVAFDDRVAFVANQGQCEGRIRHGFLRVPVDPDTPAESKPAWIVDGQQRVAAIQEADIESFPVSVVGFQAKDDRDQRDQFILVNTTKPLPTGLVYELLPTTTALLPREAPAAPIPGVPRRATKLRRRVSAPRNGPDPDERRGSDQGQLGSPDAREQSERRHSLLVSGSHRR